MKICCVCGLPILPKVMYREIVVKGGGFKYFCGKCLDKVFKAEDKEEVGTSLEVKDFSFNMNYSVGGK